MSNGEWLDLKGDNPEPRWRRPAIMFTAALVALAMTGVSLWNVIDRGAPPLADNGLEICGFDYCVVQEAVRDLGLGVEMSRLATSFLQEGAAQDLADELVSWLGEDPVRVEAVDRLEGRTAGQYSPASRTILLERPIRAWIVVHEVAHTIANGHDDFFVETLTRLVVRVTEGS